MTQRIQNGTPWEKPDRMSEMTILSGFFLWIHRPKIGRVPYSKSTGRPLFLPGGIW